MAGTTKLRAFNGALMALGVDRLTDTGEAVKAGRELVYVWDQVVEECLSAGSWNFAMEVIKATADTGVSPEFGHSEVFAKPSDWVRTIGLSADEHFTLPLTGSQGDDDSNYWTASISPIYARYVSNDTGLGLDLTRWPAKFSRYVELELADRVCITLTQNDALKERTEMRRDKAKTTALNIDSMNEPQPKFPPPGSWTQARGSATGRGDRGSRGSLIG